MKILTLENVSKTFGNKKVVDVPKLELEKGNIIGLLGPNGAGKTTTIRMIMRIIYPDTGEILFENAKMTQDTLANIGYLPEERGLFPKSKVKETIEFFGKLKDIPSSELKSKIDHYLGLFELTDYADKKVEELSRGMQQKLQFIITIIPEPDLIILDEPFTGLDPINVEILKDLILKEKERGATIIFSTHMMEKVEQICEDIVLINKGQPVLTGSITDVKERYTLNKIMLEFEGDDTFIREGDFVRNFEKNDSRYAIHLKDGIQPEKVLEMAINHGSIKQFVKLEPHLSDIFLQAVGKGKNDEN